MSGFSEFLQHTWNHMRSLRDPFELTEHALKHCVLLSTEWNDHHNAAELLMGAWSQLSNCECPRPEEFADRIKQLPNYEDMLQQSFFVNWMERTFDRPTEPNEDRDDSFAARLASLNNLGDRNDTPVTLTIPVPSGYLSVDKYVEMSRIAYRDATQSVQGLGGVVALADTNAEVQGYNPRHSDSAHRSRVLFRNAPALHFEEVKTADSLPALAKDGAVTIVDVRLG